MQCKEFIRYAGAWMEGERAAAARAHQEGCARCRGLIGDLEAIRTAAHSLEDEWAPPARVWIAIRGQVEAEGLIRTRSWEDRLAELFPAWPQPALAAAYLSVLIVAAALVSFQQFGGSVAGLVPAEEQAAVALLPTQLSSMERRAVSTVHEHDPSVTATYQENLAIVDNFIRLCENTVREEPGNDLAREYLYAAYHQKADLLAVIMERGAAGE